MSKPCYEDFVHDLPVKCLEDTETGENYCLVLENGGCWENCDSGKQNESYKLSKKAEKAKLAKAREIREEIWELFDPQIVRLSGVTEIGFKRQLTQIIKKHL